MRRWLSIALLAAFFCVSCATNFRLPHPQEEAIPDGKAKLYVFLDYRENDGNVPMAVSIDRSDVAVLRNWQFAEINVGVGPRVVGRSVRYILFQVEDSVEQEFQPGRTYYLKLTKRGGREAFQWVNFQTAYRYLAGMKRLEASER